MKIQKILDRLFFPLLIFLSPERSRKLGLTPIDDERINMCLKYSKGRVLDIGCGDNRFIKQYKNGVGVDIYQWKGIDILVRDTSELSFKDKSFDTVTFIACLNHIPNRKEVLKEAHRVLKDDGTILITMINPIIGYITHKIRYIYDTDQLQRGVSEGETFGLWSKEIDTLLKNTGFRLINTIPFVYRLNALYIGEKKGCEENAEL